MSFRPGMRAACVITFRAANVERLRNLRFVLQQLDRVPGVEPLVVEQDARPRLTADDVPPSCRVRFVRNPGAFNKSWGFNVGFRSVDADVLVFADADLLVSPRHLAAAVDACAGGYDVVRPWTDVVDLTEEETRSLVAGALDVAGVGAPGRRGRRYLGEQPPFCGGLYVVRRETYARLGGQDERFRGWGGEDDAMSMKVQALCRRVAVVRDGLVFHLHHPRHSALPIGDADYQHNVALLRDYQALSRAALEDLCAGQARTMGDEGLFS